VRQVGGRDGARLCQLADERAVGRLGPAKDLVGGLLSDLAGHDQRAPDPGQGGWQAGFRNGIGNGHGKTSSKRLKKPLHHR